MKIHSLYAALSVLLSVIFSACDSKPDVEGTWVGTMQQLSPTGQEGVTGPLVNSSVVTRIQFLPMPSDSIDGKIVLMSDISAQDEIAEYNGVSLDVPYEVSVAASSSIEGTYKFADDDDIAIFLDNSTLQVTIDPKAVKFTSNALTGQQNPEIENLREGQYWRFNSDIMANMRLVYSKYQNLSDVKIKDNILSCEVSDRDMTFRKVGQNN